MDLHKLTAHQLHQLLKAKEVSSVEITKSMFDRIEQVDQQVKAYITVTKEQALSKAQAVDQKIASGQEIRPLAGIPGALKDNMCTKGVATTCSSKILESFVPPYNATVVDKLEQADAVCLGKLNMDEFAMGSSTENSGLFNTCNPWNLKTVPGGSSGGSVAAVAADEAIFTLGSDTGGSIRQPAAFCGVVGMKPTYGLVSRYGLVAYASSLDQIGPITKDVTDCALVLNAICGHDPMDSTSVNMAVPDFAASLKDDVKGMKIGIPKEYFAEGLDSEVEKALQAAIAKYQELGATVEEVSLPTTSYALPAYYIIASSEASSNLARFDGVRYGYRDGEAPDIISMYKRSRSQGFGPEVKRRIMLGTYALSSGYYDAYYLKALKVRTLIKREIDQALDKYHVLLTPTAPTVAFEIGAKSDDPLTMYLSDVCTIPANLAGIPAISIPCGLANGMPIGMQLMGKAFGEGTILRAAYTFEQNTDFHKQKAALAKE